MSELIRVADGGRFLVRTMEARDADVVRAGYLSLSRASLHSRFFSPLARLTPAMLDDLVAVVPGERIVLLAFDLATGELAGGARAMRAASDPAFGELAVTVCDGHQRRGLGTLLLRSLRRTARAQGIERLGGHVLTDNAAARALIRGAGGRTDFDEPGVLRFEIPIRRPAAAVVAA